VVHGDIDARHIFVEKSTGLIRIIDFDRAVVDAGAEAVQRERREIERLIGWLVSGDVAE